jgi:RNA polymerase sigma factor for flagellar operon FliA
MTGSAVKQSLAPYPASLCATFDLGCDTRLEARTRLTGAPKAKKCKDKLPQHAHGSTCGRPSKHALQAVTEVVPAQADHSRRDELILEHLPLVHVIAFHIQRALPIHIEIDDLKHAGMMGLFDAATKYEPAKEVAFRSYAKHRIRGAILDSLRDLDWASRDLRRRHKQVEVLKRSLTEKLDREPTAPELAEAIGIDMHRFRAMLVDFRSVSLAAAKLRSNRDTESAVQTEAPCSPDALPDRLFVQVEMRERINDAMQVLPRRYQKVVFMYYSQELTMKEIGTALGVNESRVSQMHRSALTKMQNYFEQSGIASTSVF